MLAKDHEFEQFINEATAARFVVRSKPPFSGPTVVLKYLRSYTQHVAISNSRLLSLDDAGRVSFTYRNYRQGGVTKVMRLSASNFLSRSPAARPSQGLCPHQVLRISLTWQQSQRPHALSLNLR